MKIGLIQTNPQSDFKKNISTVSTLIEKASQSGVELIVLPETFTFMGPTKDRIQCAKENFAFVFELLKSFAQQYRIYIVGGSMDEVCEQEKNAVDRIQSENKLYNTSFTFAPSGDVISKYQKLHLFNLYNNEGKPEYCESDIYHHGAQPQNYLIQNNNQSESEIENKIQPNTESKSENETWNALSLICYDIRFPEMIRTLPQTPDIIFIPAAFTWETGQKHWEVLLRARAIENQCYVLACNQTGSFLENKKRNYGNSMVIDPWGNIAGRLNEEEGILICDISKNEIKKNRAKIPALKDRKIFG